MSEDMERGTKIIGTNINSTRDGQAISGAVLNCERRLIGILNLRILAPIPLSKIIKNNFNAQGN